ncbi:betaine/carnitine transporter, BCCT family [[Clostridium] aminophilum]|uniref:Betaine/carnitine transporter, BCCT family n=1 Tax=[Clostridium] aminophilum TaxID=1526 RepID=A0A1I0AMX9_9FIRM|nr:BCCT family transporter [[Clostridium] aminophilum]SES95672.1 betaine/carnitine transporter, BCCT family [[Clostridium] aminophilum]
MKDKVRKGEIDWFITLVPMGVILFLAGLFFVFSEQSNAVIGQVRFFFGDTLGSYYLIIGLGIFILSLYLAFSRYGDIVLGSPDEKPKYSFFAWGSMMFTCGLAADILFYSFSEWVMYATNPHIAELGSVIDWAGVFPLFHWSLIPWAFYLVLAVAFGFMLHVRKRNRQKYSEACRPLLGKHTEGWGGRIIDLLAVFALLAGTATTFSVATPLMATAIGGLLGIELDRVLVTIAILVVTCIVYTYSLLHGMRGISILANLCMYLFFGLLAAVFLFGGQTKFILEVGVQSMGKMMNHFIELSTFTDPLRTSNFPQDWTIYYWAYWMVWCVASPFFIGQISRGRTVRQTILGGYVFGVGSTLVSFIVLGNYSMGLQMREMADFIAYYEQTGDLYGMIIEMVQTLPMAKLALVWLLATMIAFYATSFDSIALIASCYSYRRLEEGQQPHKLIELMWCILLIVLPVALLFSESSMSNIQSVSIIAAFPIAMVILLIMASFLKDAKAYLEETGRKRESM